MIIQSKNLQEISFGEDFKVATEVKIIIAGPICNIALCNIVGNTGFQISVQPANFKFCLEKNKKQALGEGEVGN